MSKVIIEFDPTNEKEVYGAVRAACGTLETFGNYTVSLVPVPSGTAVDQPGTPVVETPATPDQPVEQAAPDAPVDPSAQSAEQVAADASAQVETPADQQPQQ